MTPLFLLFAPLTLGLRELRRVVVPVWLGLAAYLARLVRRLAAGSFLVPLMPVLALLAAMAIVAVARAGAAGRLLAVDGRRPARSSPGSGISTLYASRFARSAPGSSRTTSSCGARRPTTSAVEWVNGNLPGGRARAHRRPRHAPPRARVRRPGRPPRCRERRARRDFVRRHGITHGVVLKVERGARPPGARAPAAASIARMTAHTVTSRTLDELGPPESVPRLRVPVAVGEQPTGPPSRASCRTCRTRRGARCRSRRS